MAQGLAYIGQQDFAAGILRASARDSEPGVGVVAAENGLFDDDGDVYRRGGDALLHDALADGPITFLWSGYLGDQAKTIAATASRTYSFTEATGLTEIWPAGMPRPVLGAVVGERIWLPGGIVWNGSGAATAWTPPVGLTAIEHVCAVADRLLVAQGNRIAFSAAGNPTVFDPTDYHELPGGELVDGMMAIRDTCLVFSSYGVWTITNMSFDLTDVDGNAQQTLQRQIPEMALLHEAGLAEWAGKIVAPCVDRIFLLDTISAPIPISDSVSRLYMKQVNAGYRPGGAKVFRNHYLLPFLDGTNAVKATLVCRLNRPVRGRQIYYPWSTLTGHAGQMLCLDVRLIGARPGFSGGGHDGRLANLTDVFNPGVNVSDVGQTHRFAVEMRDLITGNGQPNHTRHMRVHLTVKGLAEGGRWDAAYSTGKVEQTYYDLLYRSGPPIATYQDVLDIYGTYDAVLHGAPNSPVISADDPDRYWYSAGSATGDNDGTNPQKFNFRRAVRTRYIRGWVGVDAPCERFTVHKIEFGVRPATHQR